MKNPVFIDEETIPVVPEEDYDDYKTPCTSRKDETSFTVPGFTEKEKTPTLRSRPC